MRDLLLVCVFPALLYFIFRRPYLGVSLWIWSAMFFPNGWVWGFASSFRYNLLIALATILSYFFQQNKIKTEMSGVSVVVYIFFIWTTISSFLTISYPEVVWHEWDLFFKIIIFYTFCILTIKTNHHVKVFLWAVALSAAYFGAAEGLKYLVTAGGHTIAGIPGSRLKDRNELALALNMTLPIIVLLYTYTRDKWLKMGLAAAVIFNVIAILGSYSRGGMMGLIVVGGYFFLQSNKKFLVSVLFILAVAIGSQFVSDKWTNRMDTINTMEEDASFLGRALAWKQATLMALDNPLFGAGFKAGQNQALWMFYEPDFDSLNFIFDTKGYRVEHAKAAHSIYFQVLGDHGIAGLCLFLLILYLSYRQMTWIVKNSEDQWRVNVARMLKVSLVAYCAGGAALSLPYFDFSFAIIALGHCLYEMERRSKPEKKRKFANC